MYIYYVDLQLKMLQSLFKTYLPVYKGKSQKLSFYNMKYCTSFHNNSFLYFNRLTVINTSICFINSLERAEFV